MGRAPCCDKANVKKGPWSPEEDAKLKSYIEQHGTGGNWIALPQKIGLKRCGKSCRLRWLNYLRPNIKHGGFSEEEDRLICSLYMSIGSRWSIIAAQLPGRTDNDIKNYWNTRLKKKLLGKQRKEYRRRRGNNNSVKKREWKNVPEGSISRNENPVEHPSNSFNSNQINPYWPELPPATQTPTMQYPNPEEAAFNDPESIRKLLIKLGGRFSDHDIDQVPNGQNGLPSFHQYPVFQTSSSPSQNPNYVQGAGIAIPSMNTETQCFSIPQIMPLDGLEFLFGECFGSAARDGEVSVNWNDMANYPSSISMSSGFGFGTQNGLLQECGFGNGSVYSTVQ